MTEPKVELAVAARDALGESAFWSVEDQALYWLDVPPLTASIQRFSPASGKHERWEVPEAVASMARRPDGRLLVASVSGLNIFNPADGSFKRIAAPEAGKVRNRSNDGAPDALGRFWFGTMQNNLGPKGEFLSDPLESVGTLYKVESDLRVVPVEFGQGIPNATCFSPDNKTLYFADTLQGAIFAYDFDLELGAISNKRIFTKEGPGYPDGACVDAEGYLWNARWEGGCIVRFAPDGRIDRTINVAARRVTSVAFGGADLGTLYITSSRIHLSEGDLKDQPDAGGIFAVVPGVHGLPRPLFAGK